MAGNTSDRSRTSNPKFANAWNVIAYKSVTAQQ